MKVPELQPVANWSEEDLALIKQGVGDKTSRPASGSAPATNPDGSPVADTGSVATYFEDKGFGFLRPDNGGRDIFFHISRLSGGQASDLVPGTKVVYELGMDRSGKIAASSVRVVPAES